VTDFSIQIQTESRLYAVIYYAKRLQQQQQFK